MLVLPAAPPPTAAASAFQKADSKPSPSSDDQVPRPLGQDATGRARAHERRAGAAVLIRPLDRASRCPNRIVLTARQRIAEHGL